MVVCGGKEINRSRMAELSATRTTSVGLLRRRRLAMWGDTGYILDSFVEGVWSREVWYCD